MPSTTCIAFKKYSKNSLVGFADIRVGRLIIRNVTLHWRGDARWASPPGCAWVQDGRLVTDGHGKIQYSQIIEFADRETRDAFSAAVWRAVEAVNPKAGMP